MKKKKIAVLSGIFLGLMFLFTIISRVRNSWLVPDVNSVPPIKSRLNYEVSGMGRIEYNEVSFLSVCEGLKIEQVFYRTGEWVDEGQALIQYEKDSVEEALLCAEIEKQECRLAYEGMGSGYRELMDDRITLLEKKTDVLKEILGNGCVQKADTAGYIREMQVQAGTVTKGDEAVCVVFGTAYVKGIVQTEYDSLLSVGDNIEVYEGNEAAAGEVTECDYDGMAKELALTIVLPDGEYAYGAEVYFRFAVQSESYDLCLPNTAVFRDAKGDYYVFAIEERNSILGNRLMAMQKKVDLLAQDDSYSAVKGEITRNDKVIYSWDREVNANSPVREK